jgi:hypothetical protein
LVRDTLSLPSSSKKEKQPLSLRLPHFSRVALFPEDTILAVSVASQSAVEDPEAHSGDFPLFATTPHTQSCDAAHAISPTAHPLDFFATDDSRIATPQHLAHRAFFPWSGPFAVVAANHVQIHPVRLPIVRKGNKNPNNNLQGNAAFEI